MGDGTMVYSVGKWHEVGKDLVYKGFIVYTLLIHPVLQSPLEFPP
jgi:hypothetical protein